MTITYSIPLQTVTLEISPAEIAEINDDVRAKIKTTFTDIVEKVKQQFGAVNAPPSVGK